ncbi:hypothetical protein [Neobacillus bataviensis]|uniref:hypothetical protein n=1 Tax=Neobacillus bataviensis TaxID=220685 RepID=UPI0016467DE3|nr:hypothetical protein [Neobacillus bataviensis]
MPVSTGICPHERIMRTGIAGATVFCPYEGSMRTRIACGNSFLSVLRLHEDKNSPW